jgi:acetoacetate decarboxylase
MVKPFMPERILPGVNEKDAASPGTSFSMPAQCPAYPPAPYRFINREYLIITYETDAEALRQVVPAPLEVPEPLVNFEFIRMPDSSGLGDYTESGQVIPVTFEGETGLYVLSMYLDNEPAIAAGREIWGFPKKLARPSLHIDPVSRDTLVGQLYYGELEVARGTMGYKWESVSPKEIEVAIATTPNYLTKIIPAADGTHGTLQLVSYTLSDVKVHEAWTGPADLQLFRHALAPVADLPVKRITSAVHFRSDLTLPYGKVVYDYLMN